MVRFLFAVLLLPLAAGAYGQDVVLNEVMSSNGNTIADEDGDFPDWIEIYNAGVAAIDLTGYGLSDNPADPFRWTFPATTLEASGYLLVWASGKDRSGSALHTPFALSRDGDALFLTRPDAVRADSLIVPAIPRDVSYGRQPDGADTWAYFSTPTPSGPNGGTAYEEFLAPPSFSHPAGFFTGGIDLTLHADDPDVTIFYTLDGSVPDEGALRYEGPIHVTSRAGDPNELSLIPTSHGYQVYTWETPMGEIFKGNVIRAAAFRPGAHPSPVATQSYFVDPSGTNRYSFSVVSLSTDADNLFGYERGILVPGKRFDECLSAGCTLNGWAWANYHERGREWERPVHVEIFDRSGGRVIGQDGGIRVHGGLSRAYRQKALRLYARNDYGEQVFAHPVFDEKPGVLPKRLMLRHSGQDWTKTMMRDAFMQRLVRHMNVDYQAYEPSVVFVNGEYWGIHNIRERIDRFYLENNYGVDPDQVDLLTRNAVVKEGDQSHFLALRTFVATQNMTMSSNYAHVKTQMDIDNFIDYSIAQIYIRNNDWPHNNIDYWRARTPAFDPEAGPGLDGRWRWILFDLDFAFGWSAAPLNHNTMAWAVEPGGNGNGSWATVLLRRLLLNEEFRTQFVTRFSDMLNTTFRPAHVRGLIDEFQASLEPEIGEHIHRWGHGHVPSSFHQNPANVEEWRANINVLNQYANDRATLVRDHLRTQFGFSGSAPLTVDVSDARAGFVQLNSIAIRPETPGVDASPYPWTGQYFRPTPVRLVAHPKPGYRFAGWEGAPVAAGDTLHFNLESRVTIRALFEVDEEGLADAFPRPHLLSGGRYAFSTWSPTAEPGSFPDHMAFYYMDEFDPTLDAVPEAPTFGAYNLTSRTRIEGLNDGGIAFINTSNEEGNPGYPGGRLGAAVLALDTRGRQEIDVTWTGGTVVPNVRVYHLRLQYRLGDEGPFTDVTDADGRPVEYVRNPHAGHAESIGPIRLPEDAEDRPYVQLMWRYYHTGERVEGDGGARDMLRIGEIEIRSAPAVSVEDEMPAAATGLRANYPNPFTTTTDIGYDLAQAGHVRIEIFDIQGRLVERLLDEPRPAGSHSVTFSGGSLASGVYFCRLTTDQGSSYRQVVLVR
jgi:hypothetical protein